MKKRRHVRRRRHESVSYRGISNGESYDEVVWKAAYEMKERAEWAPEGAAADWAEAERQLDRQTGELQFGIA